jgi:hypothetical protein
LSFCKLSQRESISFYVKSKPPYTLLNKNFFIILLWKILYITEHPFILLLSRTHTNIHLYSFSCTHTNIHSFVLIFMSIHDPPRISAACCSQHSDLCWLLMSFTPSPSANQEKCPTAPSICQSPVIDFIRLPPCESR